MKTITLGQLKQLYAVGELGSFNNRVDCFLTSYRMNPDDTEIYFEVGVLVGGNDKQKALLTQWGIIEPEPKFKDGDYIIHRNGKFMQIICRLSGSDTLYYEKESQYLFSIGSDDYNQSRLATQQEIEANTLIKLEVGSYIYHPDWGVGNVIKKERNQVAEWAYTIRQKNGNEYQLIHGSIRHKKSTIATPEQIKKFNEPELIKLEVGSYITGPFGTTIKIISIDGGYVLVERRNGSTDAFWIGSEFHIKSKIATPEQIAAFNRPWNEGIEEARKYKDGQPCLVRDAYCNWRLQYANGKGDFYSNNKKSGVIACYNLHMPLNKTTIKNLPVNE